MERKTSKKGLIFLVVGLLLLLAAGGWYVRNVIEDHTAGRQAAVLLDHLKEQQTEQKAEEKPPVVVVEGDAFCGTVVVETLGIELPVFDEWDYTKLKTAPCRYTGSIETGDMVIAAHNYETHFGKLTRLQIGDEIVFVDVGGTRHRYVAGEIVSLDGTAVTDMRAGEWDLTLFTCTRSGEQRVTVRCHRIDEP